jgi:hypothetical protein
MQQLQKLFGITTVCLLFVTATSFDKPSTIKVEDNQYPYALLAKDTIPQKGLDMDLNKLFNEVGDALQGVKIELQKIDFNSVSKEIEKALTNLNVNELFKDVNKALSEIDTKELAQKLKAEMNSTDWNKMQKDIDNALDKLKNVDLNKLKLDLKKIKIEMDPKQKESLKENLKKLQPEMEKKMNELKLEMEKLKKDVEKNKTNNYTGIDNFEMHYNSCLSSAISAI